MPKEPTKDILLRLPIELHDRLSTAASPIPLTKFIRQALESHLIVKPHTVLVLPTPTPTPPKLQPRPAKPIPEPPALPKTTTLPTPENPIINRPGIYSS